MPYFVTPRKFTLHSTRSKSPYWDRIVLVAEIKSRKYDDPTGAGHVWAVKAAYLGFMGDGASIELKEGMWGLEGDWRMPVPTPEQLKDAGDDDVYLNFTVTNTRNFADDSWREYVLKASAIGASIALGQAIDVPGAVVAAAKELGLSQSVVEIAKQLGFSSILDVAADWVEGLFVSPPQCAGLVFGEEYPITPYRLDGVAFADGGRIVDAVEISLRHQVLAAHNPISVQEGCKRPNGLVEFDIERHSTLYFPQEDVEERAQIAGVWAPASAVPTGLLVDERTVFGPQNRVKVQLTRRENEHADLFDVTVWEYDKDFRQVFTAAFPGIWFAVERDDIPPAKNIYGDHQQGFVLGLGGGEDPLMAMRFPHTGTRRAEMSAPDGSTVELSLWRTASKDDAGAFIEQTNELRYSRSGTERYTDTHVWLAPSAPVR